MRTYVIATVLAVGGALVAQQPVQAQCGACLEDSNPVGHAIVNAVFDEYDNRHWWEWGELCHAHDNACPGEEQEEEQDLELLAMAHNAFTLDISEVYWVAQKLGGEVDLGTGQLRFKACGSSELTEVPIPLALHQLGA